MARPADGFKYLCFHYQLIVMGEQRPFYIEVPDVPFPVQAGIALLHMNRFEVQEYVQDPAKGVVLVDDSRLLNKIYNVLKAGRGDGYSSLLAYGMNKRLLYSGKVSEAQMRERIGNLDADLWKRYWVWAEFMDSTPGKRGHRLERGKNAVLYRGDVKVSGETLDASKAEVVQVNIPTSGKIITADWRGVTGASEDTHHYPANLKHLKETFDGSGALVWVFGGRGWPVLRSGWGPFVRDSGWGAVLGSRQSADELVKNFETDEDWNRSRYQEELDGLEKELSGIRNRIKALRNLKP